jgi:hypothetical protein
MILKCGLSGVTYPCNKRRMGHPLLYQGKKSDFVIWLLRPDRSGLTSRRGSAFLRNFRQV